jgi:hypothetical protein
VQTLAFSPDGQTLATGARDRVIRLWDVATGQDYAAFRGHSAEVFNLAFADQGQTLASAGGEGKVLLWDAGRGKYDVLRLPNCAILGLAISPDGQQLAIGTRGRPNPDAIEFGSGAGPTHFILQGLRAQTLAPAGVPLAGMAELVVASQVAQTETFTLGPGGVQLCDLESPGTVHPLSGCKEESISPVAL